MPPTTRSLISTLLAASTIGLPLCVLAQTSPHKEAEDQGLRQFPPAEAFTQPVAPTSRPSPEPARPLPPTPAQDLASPVTGGVLSEGTFITGARARIAKGKTGTLYAIFDSGQQAPSGQAIPAMIVMPNLHLTGLERLAQRLTEGDRVALSGQVFLYAGVNHLLLSAPPVIEGRPDPAPETKPDSPSDAPPPATDTPAPEAAPSEPDGEPTIEQIIEQMDRAVGKARRVEIPHFAQSEAEIESAVASAPIPGGFLVSRRGRVVRAADGAPLFVMDNGIGGAKTDAPLVLLPSMNLTRLEQIASTRGEKATFTVSGDVVLYRGRNYLLPRIFTVNRTQTDVVVSGQ